MPPKLRNRPPSIPVLDTRIPDLDATPPATMLWERQVRTDPIRGLAIDSEMGVAAVGGHSGIVWVVEVETGELVTTLYTDGFVWDLAFSADHQYLTAIGVHGEMYRWDWSMDAVAVDGVHPGRCAANSHPALSPDGAAVAIQQVDGIAVWDVGAMAFRSRTEPLESIAGSLALAPQGRHLLFTGSREGPPMVVTRPENGFLRGLPEDKWRRSPAVRGVDDHLRIWDTTDGSRLVLPDRVARFNGTHFCFADDRTLVLRRAGLIESIDWTTGERAGPSVRCPGGTQSLRVSGDLVGAAGGGWYVVNWRTGAVIGGEPQLDRKDRSKPRAFEVRVDETRAIAVVTFRDGIVCAFQLDGPEDKE
jgi:hypothetical protein